MSGRFESLLVVGMTCLAAVSGLAAGEKPRVGEAAEFAAFSWLQTATSLELRNDGKTVWKLVADPKEPKSWFHPLATLDGEVLTEFEPKDHPWHHGLWRSWKFINGLNYREEVVWDAQAYRILSPAALNDRMSQQIRSPWIQS